MSSPNDFDYGLDTQGRIRLFGIYRAKVLDIEDPLKKSRIKVSIPQATGTAKSGWAHACMPITYNADHPNHKEHTAAQIAALLTTVPTSTADAFGSTDIPALTIVPVSNPGTLEHPHKTDPNEDKKWNDKQESTDTDDHTPHRIIPRVGQKVWVMFIGGDPEYPVWMGVEI